MLRPQLRLCRMAWVRGEGRESNKATNIYEIGHNNMKRTNLHMQKYNGYNHCATKPVHRRSVDNLTKHKTQLLNTGSTILQEIAIIYIFLLLLSNFTHVHDTYPRRDNVPESHARQSKPQFSVILV